MKHRLTTLATSCLLLGLLLGIGAPTARATPIMMMTEYVENSIWFNNAIEITNVGTTPGSLAGYTLDMYNNGSSTTTFQIVLTGVTLAPGDTWVVTTNLANDPTLLAESDQAAFFNISGNDAIVLANAGVPVDSIGQVGFNPGQAWGTNPSTRNTTLRRDPLLGPDANPGDAFDPGTQWTGAPTGDVSGLGTPPPGVPEPSSAMLLLGAVLLAGLVRSTEAPSRPRRSRALVTQG